MGCPRGMRSWNRRCLPPAAPPSAKPVTAAATEQAWSVRVPKSWADEVNLRQLTAYRLNFAPPGQPTSSVVAVGHAREVRGMAQIPACGLAHGVHDRITSFDISRSRR